MRITLGVVAAGLGLVAASAVAWLIVRKGASAAQAVGTVADAVNPTNPNNVAARAVNAVVQTVTGDPTTSLGSKLFDLFNPGTVAREASITAPSMPRASIVIKASDLASTFDRDDAELGASMRAFEYFNTVDRDDAELGAAMTAAQGPSLAYRLDVGRRK